MATDTELNQFLGIKQYAAFRADGGAGAGRVGRDKRLWELKKALKGRKWGEEPVDEKKNRWKKGTGANEIEVVPKGKGKKRVGKKERSRLAAAAASGEGDDGAGETEDKAPESKKRRIG